MELVRLCRLHSIDASEGRVMIRVVGGVARKWGK